ncbi:PAS domain S-box protein [Desulforhopalus vacuolatus]|uniref:PAS domain S-box protein n=1 Tax=Desulforhopalus vacuolatus TaxID=40414 RepID=UPI001965D49F|nr:PAS domain S-box protein [Desulforhopalus vacuolatus]MBM9520263.1 PAS domain S-box protein [Desulforhopalus vacuolatus]
MQNYNDLDFMLLDVIPSSVLFLDKNLRILSANRNYLKKNRLKRSDTVGRSLPDVFPQIILEHLDIIEQIRQVFRSNKPTKGHRMTYRAPGVPLTNYYYRISPYSHNGIVDGVIFLMDDITEQVRLNEEFNRVERHLASVVNYASDMVLSLDIQSHILTWNRSATRIIGYSYSEAINKNFLDFFSQESILDIQKVLADQLAGRSSQRIGEWDIITKQGVTIRASWVCSPMFDNQKNVIGIVAIGRDLSEYQKLQMDLVRSQKFAALGVMAGGIAHEIRNPLAISSSSAQFLMESDITEEFRKECAEKIYSGIQRASGIIENLLKYARPSMNVDMEPMVLSILLQDTLLLIRNQAKIQKINIISEIQDSSIRFKGIRNLIQQVFMNLFLNAIEAMPKGGTLTISMKQTPTTVSVYITDTGVGIAEDEIGKIFDPFYTTMSTRMSTGLGLALSYSIVKQHFGVIEVRSEKGNGSTFIVRLPTKDGRSIYQENT